MIQIQNYVVNGTIIAFAVDDTDVALGIKSFLGGKAYVRISRDFQYLRTHVGSAVRVEFEPQKMTVTLLKDIPTNAEVVRFLSDFVQEIGPERARAVADGRGASWLDILDAMRGGGENGRLYMSMIRGRMQVKMEEGRKLIEEETKA